MNNLGKIFIFFLILVILLQYTKSAKILGVFPVAGKSMYILAHKLMKGLADAGHDVTMVSPYENKDSIKNGSYKDYVLTGFEEDYNNLLQESNLFDSPTHNNLWASIHYTDIFAGIWKNIFHHSSVKELLKSNATFDVFITEQFIFNDCLKIFAHIYDCPTIIFTSMGGANPWVNEQVGNPLPPSYVQHFFLVGDYSKGMTFFERTYNFLFYIVDFLVKHLYSFPINNNLLRSTFDNPPDVSILNSNVSLVLLGSHFSLRQPVPIVPNVVEIGGFHIDPPKKLPKDLQEFLDNAKDGVIYFSMGSHLQSKYFSDEKKQIFLNVFGGLKEKVLWKFEDEILPGQPKNVFIKKWLPQLDILAHPNVKLFITHGGYGSTLETIYHGVPTLAIPVFIDQFNNAYQQVQNGFALKLGYNDKNFNEPTLKKFIQDLLNNPKYRENAKKISKLFHDRPMKPMETAVYWIEYVIRYNGANHLKVAGVSLPWYQYYMVDIILFLITSSICCIYGLYVLLKIVYCKKYKSNKDKLN